MTTKQNKQSNARKLKQINDEPIIDIDDIPSADESDEDITTEEFDALLKEQTFSDVDKWTDLEQGEIYRITSYRTVDTSRGESVIISVKRKGHKQDVWCPSHLATKIEDKEPPFHVRPLGLKPCKNNKKNKYHAYDLVFPKQKQTAMHKDYVKK